MWKMKKQAKKRKEKKTNEKESKKEENRKLPACNLFVNLVI